MEIRIGIINTGRELSFETSAPADEVRTQIAGALDQGASHVTLSDTKGNSYIVPTARLAYVELGSPTGGQVGFRS